MKGWWKTMKIAVFALVLIAVAALCVADELDNHRVSADFQDADLSSVLKMLFSQAGVSYALGEDVRGLVTAHIENLPISEALRAILSPRGFVVVKHDSTYTVQRKASAEKTVKPQATEPPRRTEETAFAGGESRIIIEKIPLKYIDAYELAALLQGSQGIQPPAREYRPTGSWNIFTPSGTFVPQPNWGYGYPGYQPGTQWNYGLQPYPWQPSNVLQPINPNSRFDIYNRNTPRTGPLLSP